MNEQNQKPAQPAPNDSPFKTDLVDNIPLHQAAPAAAPISEAEDIDGIMKAVAKEVKKVDETPKKHHMFGHKTESKPDSHHTTPVPAPAAPPPPAATSGAVPRQPAPAPKPQQTKAKSSVPIMTIFFVVIITAFLIVAAISAYKK